MPRPPPPPRLALIQAREAHTSVIFRRGPSKWVEIVSWDTRKDTFLRGSWFRGRIYHRRSDLSPDGTKLIYFASKLTAQTMKDAEYTYAWTAVSKVPYLSALALWPKGNCWWGGGLFADNYTVWLNHRPEEAAHHPRHRPHRLRVIPNPDARGEDGPIYSARLTRDSWFVQQEWKCEQRGWDGFETLQPELRRRAHPEGALAIIMERRLDGLRYRERFTIVDRNGVIVRALNGVDWADWDQRGRLVVLERGHVSAAAVAGSRLDTSKLLIDLIGDVPTPEPPPVWAQTW